MDKGIIYCATNTLKGEKYIGKTTRRLSERKMQHLSSAYRKHTHNWETRTYFNAMLAKYEEYFVWEVLEYVDVNQLDEREAFWIWKLNTLFPKGYNSVKGNSKKGFDFC